MTSEAEDFLLQAWKRQVDSGMHLVETLVEGATRLHEVQIDAAADAHADLEATRKSLAAAADMPQLLELQGEWAAANARKCAAYWRDLYAVMAQTQSELARCACAKSAALSEKPPNKALAAEPATAAAVRAKPRANGAGRTRGERRPAT